MPQLSRKLRGINAVRDPLHSKAVMEAAIALCLGQGCRLTAARLRVLRPCVTADECIRRVGCSSFRTPENCTDDDLPRSELLARKVIVRLDSSRPSFSWSSKRVKG